MKFLCMYICCWWLISFQVSLPMPSSSLSAHILVAVFQCHANVAVTATGTLGRVQRKITIITWLCCMCFFFFVPKVKLSSHAYMEKENTYYMLGMLKFVGKLVFSFASWDAYNELKKKFLISHWNFFKTKIFKMNVNAKKFIIAMAFSWIMIA